MKKVNEQISRWGKIDEIESKLKLEYGKNLKNEAFKKLVTKLPLQEEYLMKYTSRLGECAVEHNNCANCPNIAACKNDVPGFAFTPEVKGKSVIFSYVLCKYKKDLDKKNRYQKNIYYYDMPKEIKNAKVKDIFPGEEEREKIILWLDDYIENYDSKKEQKGLYLYGNFGSGKTYLIAAMFNELAKKDHKIAIIYWPEYLRDLKASFDSDFAQKYNYIKTIPLLLIDDIGAENSTPWARDEILGPLLQHRMQEKLSTFFTSNLSLEELETHFSMANYKTEPVKAKRIIERIKQLSKEMKMVSKNNRK
ncbi:MAG: primosomal protein DnaI [Bacilli bacterium]|nr:primosomal protein DnaI [Bacilli bacterium]